MEAIRKYIDASRLMDVTALPETFKYRKFMILVFMVEKQEAEKVGMKWEGTEEMREERQLKYTEKGVKGWQRAHRNER